MPQNSCENSTLAIQKPAKPSSPATTSVGRFGLRKPDRDRSHRTVDLRRARCVETFVVGLIVLAMLGCGTSHANLVITAPSTATAGIPFDVTVNVMYAGKPDTVINSMIEFSSSDGAAVLPGIYQFTAADAGSHTWPNGATLNSPGNQTITANIIMATGITGTVNIAVSAQSTTQ